MSQAKVTPWRDQAELLQIRSHFYPTSESDVDDRIHAVHVVNAWSIRGSVPHEVESTAALTAAILNDDDDCLPYCAEFAYSGAICLFVTRLVDPGRKGIYVKSMYGAAERVHLPASFVDLRHDATHGPPPSLAVLRVAAKDALAWLWDHYWRGLTVHLDRVRQRILAALTLYGRRGQENDIDTTKASEELLRIVQGSSETCTCLASRLVEHNLKSMKPANRTSSPVETLIRDLTTHRPAFFSTLVSALISQLTTAPSPLEDATPHRATTSVWLVYLLTHPSWVAQRYAAPPGFFDHAIATCLMSPDTLTVKVVERLVESGVEADAQELWGDAIALAKLDQSDPMLQCENGEDAGPPHEDDENDVDPTSLESAWTPKPIGVV
ncbi:MAG: rRNA-processing protein las1 [Thelocarpon impressellum]|nr:MAG: rRNA-processing protein las1 [Thelocarpon impressellum]